MEDACLTISHEGLAASHCRTSSGVSGAESSMRTASGIITWPNSVRENLGLADENKVVNRTGIGDDDHLVGRRSRVAKSCSRSVAL